MDKILTINVQCLTVIVHLRRNMHIFFHGWFVGSIEFVYVQHILTFFFFLLSDSKAICNYNTALFFFESQETG